MPTSLSSAQRIDLADKTRKLFLSEAARMMADLSGVLHERLLSLMNLTNGGSREMQNRRDVFQAYTKVRTAWVTATIKAWESALKPVVIARASQQGSKSTWLELVGTDVVENKIISSRMVMEVSEKVSRQLDDLKLRIKFLDGDDGFDGLDILMPEISILLMIEKWVSCGMSRDSWVMVNEAAQRLLMERLNAAYKKCNEFLIARDVMPRIDFKDRVKRLPSELSPRGQRLPDDQSQLKNTAQPRSGGFSASSPSRSPQTGEQSSAPNKSAGLFGGRLSWGSQSSGPSQGQRGAQSDNEPHEETRMLTRGTPLAQSQARSRGVIGQLKDFFVGQVGGADFAAPAGRGPSPGLTAAIENRLGKGAAYREGATTSADAGVDGVTVYEDFSPAGMVRFAGQLREQTTELKKQAETKSEKATIEIVALMFQAILAEERIPAAIRVWFARLQMPVLRVALAEPDFFGTLNHPARQLIDRMGSCVMGFDATGINGSTMEIEIKRIVQVIEQYPETGKKVFQIVYDEFQKFLAKALTGKESTLKVVSVAQQVEQKETLTIQYTIEMRNLLKDMPVRDEIRAFLFKVWAEVLAVSAIRKGPQHADAIELKKSASDLVWAASAKPNRADRTRVIQDLPNLLQRLRTGMSLLGMPPSMQDEHIKIVSDTMAEAFMSKTQAIPQAQIDDMTKRLANLEDFVSEDGVGDLPLDAESIEMMLGIEASMIEVVANGGSKPTPAMAAWAKELQTGAWFTLDHNGKLSTVQFAWRSDRKHLNLFASNDGKSFLIQAGRLAAYLQAGLLLPQEEETLTVRATRDALRKLEANPERLLGSAAA